MKSMTVASPCCSLPLLVIVFIVVLIKLVVERRWKERVDGVERGESYLLPKLSSALCAPSSCEWTSALDEQVQWAIRSKMATSRATLLDVPG